jgi:hypothetical protein
MKNRKLTKVLVLCAALGTALFVSSSALAWTVTMDAQPKLKRTYAWKIEKSVSESAVTLNAGETATVTYTVTATPTGSVDSNWSVSGLMEMSEDPDITIGSVIFRILPEEILATHSCMPSTFPVELGIEGLKCTYSAALPNANARTAWMRAVVSEPTGFRNVLKPFTFANATVDEVDETVTVTDTMGGTLGTVNAADGPKTFTYTKTIGPYTAAQCGSTTIANTASFLTGDTGATGSADADVDVLIPCVPSVGCTHTIGYWKNHAGFGPQADDVTPLLPLRLGALGGAKTINVTTAAMAVSLLKMEGSNGVKAASNGINKLYAQLLGAKLSRADGANGTVVGSVIGAADAFLANHDSLSWTGLTSAQQAMVNGWMTSLDRFNNGLSGVAHCG